MIRWKVVALLLLIPVLVAGQEEDPGKLDRIKEIEGWTSAVGTWEGEYFVEAAPEELLQSLKDKGTSDTGIGIKLILHEDKASVFFKYEPGGEWSGVTSEARLIPDQIAWHVLMGSEGGVWLERYSLSFMRVEEEVAKFVITRTVHNWYDTGAEEFLNTYHVFGAGRVTRLKGSE